MFGAEIFYIQTAETNGRKKRRSGNVMELHNWADVERRAQLRRQEKTSVSIVTEVRSTTVRAESRLR